jgi:hypothetical protein
VSIHDHNAPPHPWRWGFSVNDGIVIDSLDDDMRAVVERYVRKHHPDVAYAGESDDESEYRRGFEDAQRECSDALDSVYLPRHPKKRRQVRP